MPSTFDPLLRLELQGVGENPNTWGIKTNTNFELLGQAIAGHVALNVAGSGTYVLSALNATADEARRMIITLTGALTGTRIIQIPSNSKIYIFRNITTGGHPVQVKTSSGAAVTLPSNAVSMVMCNGADCFLAQDDSKVSKSGDTMTGALIHPAGSATAPSISFTGDTDTGIFQPSVDQVAISTGGTQRAIVTNSTVNFANPVRVPNGSAAAPSLSFEADTNTGVFRIAEDELGVTTGGTQRLTVTNAAMTVAVPQFVPSGSEAAPSIGFSGDADTGIFRVSADQLGFTTGGTQRLTIGIGEIFSSVAARITGNLRVDRDDTGSEGGRLISRRASDNADSWFWQAHGSGTNPIMRLVDQNGTPAVRAWFTSSGHLHLTADATASDQAVRFGQLSTIRANVQQFDSSGTWTKPTGYDPNSLVRIQCWAGGASGARHSTPGNAGGGGGGGYNERWMRLSALGATETVTIGAGGAAVSGSNANGNPGGNTSFGSHLTAYGGAGGIIGSAGGYGGGGGGQLSAGSSSNAGGPNLSGQGNGAFHNGVEWVAAMASFWHGGGGGGGGWPAGAASIWGGAGGGANTGSSNPGGASINGGAGGAGGGATGTAGSVPGGGGGAGTSTSGAGGNGRVIVTVFAV